MASLGAGAGETPLEGRPKEQVPHEEGQGQQKQRKQCEKQSSANPKQQKANPKRIQAQNESKKKSQKDPQPFGGNAAADVVPSKPQHNPARGKNGNNGRVTRVRVQTKAPQQETNNDNRQGTTHEPSYDTRIDTSTLAEHHLKSPSRAPERADCTLIAFYDTKCKAGPGSTRHCPLATAPKSSAAAAPHARQESFSIQP
jgi:hypothetical protein